MLPRIASLILALLPCIGAGQQPTGADALACAQFEGVWRGAFSQGQYGPQRIDVRHVSPQCQAQVVHNPGEGAPEVVYELPIREGAMEFACSVPGGRCRLELNGGELLFTFKDPSGFVNTGVFRRKP